MDRTFHIAPKHQLAAQAAEEVRALADAGHEFVAIRGESLEWRDGSEEERLYGVWPAREEDHTLWGKVRASDWLAAFDGA